MVLNDYQRGLLADERKLSSLFEWAQMLRHMKKDPIDLSIGNPNLGPPRNYYQALEELITESKAARSNLHGYVPNRGLRGTREKIATYLTSFLRTDFKCEQIFMTAGAANALDVMLRVLVEPVLHFREGAPSGAGFESCKDVRPCEVVILAPYFLEYRNYIEKNQGRVRVAFSDQSFRLDFDEIEKNITDATRVVILNSPNNPTGVLYREDELEELARILETKNREFNSTICVIEDGSYAQVLFENSKLSSIMPFYRYTFFVSSFSKSLGIAGERLGYIAAHPRVLDSEDDWSLLQQAISVNIRMTVVDAPVLQQRVVQKIGCETTVDISVYQRKVLRLADTLKDLGFEFTYPEGAFYIFALIPEQFTDGEEFQMAVQSGDEPILYIPGYAFGGERYNDYVRFSVCVDDRTIDRACEQLARVCRHT